ncbi:MAG: hypothetical protein JW712_01405 [Dehalococcoidales bacterium]|nr:hypothetical protein [Dehalococcoidales bacterium]
MKLLPVNRLYSVLLLVVLMTGLISGCTGKESSLSISRNDFTFSSTWDEILRITGVEESTVRLDSYELKVRETGIQGLSVQFLAGNGSGQPFMYYVQMDKHGVFTHDVYESSGYWDEYNPRTIFNELDRYGLPAIAAGADSTGIRIRPADTERTYEIDDIFLLENGILTPLRRVSFGREASWAGIEVFRYYPDDFGTGPLIIDSLRVLPWQTWFVSEDLDNAETVDYLENRQDVPFKKFILQMHEYLPPGWEMTLRTQESMDPPRGLDEPLFRLDFKDTVNWYTIPGDPTDTRISPGLRLYFYDVDKMDTIMEVVREQSVYSWDIPLYYDQSTRYMAVTSPVYINSGMHDDEAMEFYTPLAHSLRQFFIEERDRS